jgi:hypothetical protein
MGLNGEGSVLLKEETHSRRLCDATRKNNQIGSVPFRQASYHAYGDQTQTLQYDQPRGLVVSVSDY